MKPFSSIFLTALLCGATCLVSSTALAEGEDYTIGSDSSNQSLDSQALSEPSSALSNNSNDYLIESPSQVENTSDGFNFPLTTCGDKPSGNNDTWYPVFVDGGNLDNIRSQFCADAISTIREDTKFKSVQVASFNNRDRALKFAQLVGGEVGKPTYPANVEQSASEEVEDIPRAADRLASTITPSLVTTSSPSPETTIPTPSSQTVSSSPVLNEESGKGWLTWIIPVLVLLSIVLKRRNVSQTNHLNSYKTNSNGQQTLPDTAIDSELEALRRQVANGENKMQSNQPELPNAEKPSTVKETIGQITVFIIMALMFRGCITGSNESAISGSSTSACSQAEAKLERAIERRSEWSQENPTISRDNLNEATSVGEYEAEAMNERDGACR
jgi:hypothetical protein